MRDRCWRLHRDLLRLRRAHPALSIGAVHLIEAEGDVLAYERVARGRAGGGDAEFGQRGAAGAGAGGQFPPALSTLRHLGASRDDDRRLAPDEGLILLATD